MLKKKILNKNIKENTIEEKILKKKRKFKE